jgi:hypothetical protein
VQLPPDGPSGLYVPSVESSKFILLLFVPNRAFFKIVLVPQTAGDGAATR